ncbi:alkene reductase [Shewanella gelidii]|uniref:Alkene reductase n=1 Tax=Shewanella gelidii TaxID=1642821 RepID=A0A917N6J1_9GAMM|nr:alkene reductase [Shewanella gelidii]MCL1096553.1 alkene reductase [Shewanella gelidii]GGI68361.1 alkene reductase [Shewanella gelidii]
MLFSPFTFDAFQTKNRVVMAPMTRSRSTQPGDIPNLLMAEYYRQRASAGLIISEGVPVSAVGRGYSMTPGIYTAEQIAGWQQVTQAVHDAGGKIFAQLWHVGRRSHERIAGQAIVAPSAIKIPDQVYGPLPDGGFGMIETSPPKAMSTKEILATKNDFVQAAKNAIAAGFDGVEIHGAHGYLFDQFLRIASNQRTDEYGGSLENRMRLLVDTLAATVDAIGASKVAVRLSPMVTEGAASEDPEIVALTMALLQQLAPMRLAYVHFSENIGNYLPVTTDFRRQVRSVYPHPIMVAGKQTKQTAQALLQDGLVDLVAFGTPYVTNPDLVERMANEQPLAEFDSDARLSLYGGGAEGYTDYPRCSAKP